MGRPEFTVTLEHDELLALISLIEQNRGSYHNEEWLLVKAFPGSRVYAKLLDARDGVHGRH